MRCLLRPKDTSITTRSSMSALRARLGPGLLFAAAAVGTSHLVQATRAGAAFGLTLALLIVVMCLIKYPLFRFAVDYAATTGEGLIAGYARRGRPLVLIMLAATVTEAIAATAGIALVSAGIAKWLFAIPLPDLTVTLAVLALTTLLVGLGRYRLLESLAGVFVLLFSILTVLATVLSLPALGDGSPTFGSFTVNAGNLSFATAVAGWMPIGNTASMMIAAWVLARQLESGERSLGVARFDFNLGYGLSSVLALCFLVMGTGVLFGRGLALPGGGAQFAAVFTDMFAQAVGGWARLLVGAAALAVMYSTLLAVVDGFPRLLSGFLSALSGRAEQDSPVSQGLLMLLTVSSAALFISCFLSSFTAFIDLVTILGFVAAPIVAWANHAVITSAQVPAEARPGPRLVAASYLAISLLLVASLAFLYFRFAG